MSPCFAASCFPLSKRRRVYFSNYFIIAFAYDIFFQDILPADIFIMPNISLGGRSDDWLRKKIIFPLIHPAFLHHIILLFPA
jgi:hypothetical protein